MSWQVLGPPFVICTVRASPTVTRRAAFSGGQPVPGHRDLCEVCERVAADVLRALAGR